MSLQPLVSKIKLVTLRDQVYLEIQNAIIEGRFKPGDRIYEEDLTKLLGVSRTPVREALGLLEWDGLVEIRPNKGCHVLRFDEQDIRDIFFVRQSLENLAAEIVTENLTQENFRDLQSIIDQERGLIGKDALEDEYTVDLSFHEYLIKLAGSERLWNAWKAIACQYYLAFQYVHHPNEEMNLHMAIADHEQLLGAYRKGDVQAVKQANAKIIARVVRVVLAELAQRQIDNA